MALVANLRILWRMPTQALGCNTYGCITRQRYCRRLASRITPRGKADQPVECEIIDSQTQMQHKKYGLLIPLLGLPWYIGDNLGADVILTSPAAKGTAHDAQSILNAAPHEMVHAYVYTINPGIRLWLTEGMALYLTNGEPFHRDILGTRPTPSLSDTRTKNPIYFSSMGGYTFAHTYIEYLSSAYGWPSRCFR